MKHQQTISIIASAYVNGMTLAERMQATLRLRSALRNDYGLAYIPATGSYKGKLEASHIIAGFANLGHAIETAQQICIRFNQESVLLQDNEGFCHLVDKSGRAVSMGGRMMKVSEEYARQQEAYTKVNKDFYVVRPSAIRQDVGMATLTAQA